MYINNNLLIKYVSYNVTDNGEAVEPCSALPRVISYIPYGEIFVEQQSGGWQSPYLFNAKELDSETGLYYYGARYFDPTSAAWLSVDPLWEKYVGMSPYGYCAGNPVRLVDPDGKAPETILEYSKNAGFYRPFSGYTGGYRFKSATIHLLSLVSGVEEDIIARVSIIARGPGHYLPGYSANIRGGGAITLGDNRYNSTIIYTENFFDDNPESYNKHGYGKDVMRWLSLSSHEVGHLKQIEQFKNVFKYIGEILSEYINAGNHDDAPMEIEAEKGSVNFENFTKFTNKKYGNGSLQKLMEDEKTSELYKIKVIDKWWNEFTKNNSNDN
ncbi:MAG: RHS repeat-associated core domain-containing protein [Paludibacteraceae bacterium]|nr:RHS repeat-associated core domain-containing protein [Paludibacteraceae bacterium]